MAGCQGSVGFFLLKLGEPGGRGWAGEWEVGGGPHPPPRLIFKADPTWGDACIVDWLQGSRRLKGCPWFEVLGKECLNESTDWGVSVQINFSSHLVRGNAVLLIAIYWKPVFLYATLRCLLVGLLPPPHPGRFS